MQKTDKLSVSQALQMILTTPAPPRRRSVLSRTGLVFVADQTNLEQLQADLSIVHLFSAYCRSQDHHGMTSTELARLANTRSKTVLGIRIKTMVMKEQLVPGSEELLLSLVEDCMRLSRRSRNGVATV